MHISPPSTDCVDNGTWTFEKIESSFGRDGVITLYVFSTFVFLLNLILFLATVYKFFQCHVLTKHQVETNEKMREIERKSISFIIFQIFNQSIMVSIPLIMAGYQMFSISRNGKDKKKRILQIFQ